MGYKKLIEQLRSASLLHGTWLRERMVEAADAIETLLSERDAAVEDLRGDCKTCTYFDKLNLHEKCVHCKYARGLSKPQAAWFDRWQWRGPQKESRNDG